jgi:hypothetical protein
VSWNQSFSVKVVFAVPLFPGDRRQLFMEKFLENNTDHSGALIAPPPTLQTINSHRLVAHKKRAS